MSRQETSVWTAIAGLALLWALPGLSAGGAPVVPFLILATALACVAHEGTRRFVTDSLAASFSGKAMRTALIVGGVLLTWQFLPLELALFAAGEALAYVELMVAIGMVVTRARLSVLKTTLNRRARDLMLWAVVAARRGARAMRRRRPTRPGGASRDDPEPWRGVLAPA